MGKGQKARLAARRERERILAEERMLQQAEAKAETETATETGASASSPFPDSIDLGHLPAIESVEDFPALPTCETSLLKEEAKEKDEKEAELVSEKVPEVVIENRKENEIEPVNKNVPEVLLTDCHKAETYVATMKDPGSEHDLTPAVTFSQLDTATIVPAEDDTETQAKRNQRTKAKNKRKQEKRRAAAIDAAADRGVETETMYAPEIVSVPFYHQYPPGMAPSSHSFHPTPYAGHSPGYQSFNPRGGRSYSSYRANLSPFGTANMNPYRPRSWNSRPDRYIQRERVDDSRSQNQDAGKRTQSTELRATAPEFVPDSKKI